MAPLPYSKLIEHVNISRTPLAPQQSNGIRKRSWPSICNGKEPRGLMNPHNYCYRRSILQSLFHLPSFLRVLQVHKPTSQLCDPQHCACVTCGLKRLSNTYWASETNVAITNAVKLFDRLVNDRARIGGTKFMWSDSKWSRGWRFMDQMDAHEFLCFLLDQLHDPRLRKYYQPAIHQLVAQLTESRRSKPGSLEDRASKGPETNLDQARFKAQLEDIFQLCYRQRMTCGACGVARNLHNQQTILGPVPLATSASSHTRKDISSCLRQFFAPDAWEIKCENKACSQFNKPKIKNRVTQSIVASPEVLMIQLKCFRSQGKTTSKKNSNISYGHSLDLSDYASKELLRKEGELRYRLCSVVLHQGSSLENGHYVGTFMGPTGAHHISDERVQKCSSNAMLPNANMKGTPYILTYVRDRAGVEGEPSWKSEKLSTEPSTPAQDKSTSKLKSLRNGSTIGSINGETGNNHEVIPQNSKHGKPQRSRHGPANDTLPKNREVRPAISPQKSAHGTGLRMAPMLPKLSSENTFRMTGGKSPFNPKNPGENSVSSHDGRPTINPQRDPKPQLHQGLSKNQIRKLKKKQRRLQMGK